MLAHELRRQILSFQYILVHTHNEDFLIIGSIEDPDPSPLGQAFQVTPKKVVVEVL
jgi:hypothetical protein